MARRTLAGKRVLITGASQGIGHSLVLLAAEKQCRVVAVARSADLLNELADEAKSRGTPIEIVTGDVTSPSDRARFLEHTIKHFGGLDVLINNAGIGATGHFMDTQPDTLRKIFEVNYFALCEMIRIFLPVLKQGESPAIVNISSVFGRRGWPARSNYSASKFAVQGFSEAIRAELAKDGVDVIVVSPGLTQTNFSKNLIENKAKIPLDHLRGMSSDTVAAATLSALAAGIPEVTLTFRGKMLVLVNRFIPWVIDFFAKKKVRELFADEIAARKKNQQSLVNHK